MNIKSDKELKKYKKLIEKSGLFDKIYYENQFKDIPQGDLLEYFILNGEKENKNPSPYFDVKYYLKENPDVKTANINPLIHYILFGKKEGREPLKVGSDEKTVYEKWCDHHRNIKGAKRLYCNLRDEFLIYKSGKFDGPWYIEKYSDAYKYVSQKKTWNWRFSKNPLLRTVARFTTTPITYYVKYGMYRNQNPNSDFSTEFYMNNNADLINGPTLTPFVHYIQYGERENRRCNYEDSHFKSLKDIYISDLMNISKKENTYLSVITKSDNDLNYDAEIIKYNDDLNSLIKNSKGNIIWINNDLKNTEDIENIVNIFKDEAVYALVIKEYETEFDILSYTDFVDIINIDKMPLDYSQVIFRKPDEAQLDTFDFNSLKAFNLSILRLSLGAKIGIYNGETEDLSLSDEYLKDYVKSVSPILFNKYSLDIKDKYNRYGSLRQNVSEKYGYKYFVENYKPEDYIKKHMPNILVGIFEFDFGGGEIMPIRLANTLHKMGYTVTVFTYKDSVEPQVRNMLSKSIPVAYTKDIDELSVIIKRLNINVVSTHHQAVQSFVSEAFEKYPGLKESVSHIATSHGMYENFDDSTLEYLFNNTKLMANTNYWTYVADKNLIPFNKFGVYDEDKFIKIPNGMERPVVNKVDLSEYGIDKDSFTIAIVSRALKAKGWLNAIEAVKIAREKTNRDIQLLLIGSGEVYDEYKGEKENEYIHFLGFRDNPCDYFSSVDLCMLPSYYVSESAPLCLIEAMMCGIPSIASDIGDVKSILQYEDKFAGSVFPLDNMTVDNNILADEIVKMVTDKDYYNECKAVAIKKAEFFEISNIASMYIDVYEKDLTDIDEYYNSDRAEKINNILLAGEEGTGPLVSVIVPNYNHSAYLPKRLDSIFNQTYKNIQVILMDDCSTDNSREILTNYNKKYPDRSILLFNENNSGGVFYQWAKGIRNSKGDICWIAESDDYCETNFLENLLPAFEDKDVTLSYCQYGFVNENNEENVGGFFNYVDKIDDEKWHKNYVNDSLNEVSEALAIKNTIPNASGAIFRNPGNMDLFDDPSWYKMKICGDWIFYLYLIQGKKIAYTVDTKSYFRFHSSNSSRKTYGGDTYYQEHSQVAQCVRRIYAPDNNAIAQNHSIIEDFYNKNVENGSIEKFNSLYNIDEVLKWKANTVINESNINKKREKLVKDKDYKTVFVNPVISAKEDPELSIEEKMNLVGANSGNMVFVDAVNEQTKTVGEIWFNGPNYEKLRAEYGDVTAVIPSSNFIIKGSDGVLKGMDRMYSQSKGNITMIGLGAQAYAPYNTPRKLVNELSDFAVNFFKMASERCVSLGVRGEFTAECLELMGIRNYRIIGCPTCYKYLDGVYKPLKTPDMSKPIFSITGKSKMESELLKLGMKANGTWLIQMMTELPQLMEDKVVDDATFNSSYPGLGLSQEELRKFMKSNGKLFFNMDRWNEFMQNENFSFSFGSRFHGNMSALRNGIPALWITHDSRTSELIDVLHLPHISIDKLKGIKNPEALLEYCDYTDFYKHYGELTREYVAFLDENAIDHNFTIK